MTEIEEKLQRLRAMLEVHGLDAALLSRNANFAWLTGGATGYVNSATDMAAASLLVTPQWPLCADQQYRSHPPGG